MFGDIEIKGVNYSEMPLQIIDTGYGLERFCWAAAGTPTIYEAIYPESVSWLKDLAGFSAQRFEMSQKPKHPENNTLLIPVQGKPISPYVTIHTHRWQRKFYGCNGFFTRVFFVPGCVFHRPMCLKGCLLQSGPKPPFLRP